MLEKTQKILSVIISLVVILILSLFILTGCTKEEETNKDYKKYDNLASNATYYKEGKTSNSFKVGGDESKKDGMYIDLGETKKFNTILLNEKSKGVTQFNIFASNEKTESTFKLIYSGDTIENLRICFVGNQEYRYLYVEVVESSDVYRISNIEVFNIINQDALKRVTTYFLIDRVDTTDLNALDTVTDIILFSWMRFDRDGNVQILVDNPDGDGFLDSTNGEKKYKENLDKLRAKVQEIETNQNRHINIFPCILMPVSDNPNDPNKFAREIMSEEKRSKTAENVKAFIEKYNFDGVDFDYEYPSKKKEYKLFDEFLLTIRSTIGENKILSAALADWNINMSSEAVATLDQVQLMTYDVFDKHGYHAAFNSSAVQGVEKAVKKGIPVEKINIGVPFYSRPISKAGYWGDYFNFFEDGFKTMDSNNPNSKFVNKVTFEAIDSGGNVIFEPEYFNGYQMIQDKMAYAIDTNIAGIMIWHMHCDLPYHKELSLFKAINETFKLKQAKLITNK